MTYDDICSPELQNIGLKQPTKLGFDREHCGCTRIFRQVPSRAQLVQRCSETACKAHDSSCFPGLKASTLGCCFTSISMRTICSEMSTPRDAKRILPPGQFFLPLPNSSQFHSKIFAKFENQGTVSGDGILNVSALLWQIRYGIRYGIRWPWPWPRLPKRQRGVSRPGWSSCNTCQVQQVESNHCHSWDSFFILFMYPFIIIYHIISNIPL